MSLFIREIAIQNRGPLSNITLLPKQFNLIYGPNERGKTHFVEFLIHSLFKKPASWGLRKADSQGRIMIDGLGAEPVRFNVTSDKLEDYWEKQETPVPLDLARLLVVKGAEVELAAEQGGIDKTILKKYLSNQEILDKIEGRIAPTILRADIQGNQIVGSKGTGPISKRVELKERLIHIDRLFEKINQRFSGSNRQKLIIRKQAFIDELTLLNQAKRHQAFKLTRQEQDFKTTLENFESDAMQEIPVKLESYQREQAILNEKQKQINQLTEKCGHYAWLKQAVDLYKTRLLNLPLKPHLLLPGIVVFSLAGTAVLIVFRLIFWSLGLIAATLAVFIVYQILMRKFTERLPDKLEFKRLQADYQLRFHESLRNLAQLEARVSDLEQDHAELQLMKKQADQAVIFCQRIRNEIDSHFQILTGKTVPQSEWQNEYQLLRQSQRKTRDQLDETRERLHRLNVDPSDYLEKFHDASYSRESENQMIQKIETVERTIEKEENILNELKNEIWQLLDRVTVSNWEALIQKLQEARMELLREYQQLTAEILGKKAIQQVIETMRSEEDKNIHEGLKSPEVTNALKITTQKYQRIQLREERLWVSDAFQEFPFSELSTGAQEQVLLALRIGFSQKLLNNDSLFLIFDDAFQYSDWQRRESLVRMMVQLANSGWQIFYFTMDDHIRDLFLKAGKTFGPEFLYYELALKE